MTLEKILVLFGFCNHRNGVNFQKELQYFVTNFVILALLILNLCVPSVVFIYENSDKVSNYVFAIFQLFASLSMALSSITVSINKAMVRKVIDDTEAIVAKCKKI